MIKRIMPSALIVVMFVVGAWAYPSMPDEIAVHWNAWGQADGFGSKAFGLASVPALTVGLYLLFLLIPKIEVFKKNIQSFIGYYQNIVIVFTGFMAALYSAMVVWNLGYRFDMGVFVMPAVAVLIYYLGHIMKHIKRNFFVGIRTPWTLANEKVWTKTHDVGGVVFRIAAVVMFLGVFAPDRNIWFVLVPLLGSVLFLIAYSYVLYQKEQKNDLENQN